MIVKYYHAVGYKFKLLGQYTKIIIKELFKNLLLKYYSLRNLLVKNVLIT